jgi:hypothetical protein
MCISIDALQRQALEEEAARVGIGIPFFDSEAECSDYHRQVRHDQVIYDQTVPAGYFYVGKGMKRSKESGEDGD